MPPTDYGTDISLVPDLDVNFALITGPRVVAESLARRFQTREGSLFWAPADGRDLRMLVGESFDDGDLVREQAAIAAEAEKDERVLSATATVDLVVETHDLIVTIVVQLADGPFTLVLGVSAVTVEILSFQ